MDSAQYRRTPARDMIGKKVKSTALLAHQFLVCPAGTEFIVRGKFKGLSLEGIPCGRCGTRVRFTKVDPRFVEFLE